MTMKVKELKNHNKINNQGPFFGTRSGGRVFLEVKLLIGALGGPHKVRGTPKGPPRSQKMVKNDHEIKKIEKP